MKTLTEKTMVPMGTAIALIGGIAIWLGGLSFRVDANSKSIDEIKKDRSEERTEVTNVLFTIKERLSNIEGQLFQLNQAIPKRK